MTKHELPTPNRQQSTQPSTTSHPIAYPIASKMHDASSPAEAISASQGLPNDGAPRGTTATTPNRTRKRHNRSDVTAIGTRLSHRDWAILQSVGQHQFLTGQQITALHFHGHAAISGPRIARRVLTRLRDPNLRILGALERRIGGVAAGSGGLIHFVDVVGDQLLRGRSGRTSSRRGREPSARFVNHKLAIADHHIAIVQAHRQTGWQSLDCQTEPAAWRRYPGATGAALVLKPDLAIEIGVNRELAYAWFIEVDLGTETIPTLIKKCREYEAYRQTGIEQEQSDSFPIVVWSVTHPNPEKADRRRTALAEAIAADRQLPTQLFRVIDPQQLTPLLQSGGQQ